MSIATDIFERRMKSIGSGDRPVANRVSAEQLWYANPKEHEDFLISAYNQGMLEWEMDEGAVTEVKLFDMDVTDICPPVVIETICLIQIEIGEGW